VSERRARAAAVLQAHGLDGELLDAATLTTAVVQAGLAAPDGAAFVEALAEFGDRHVAALLQALDAQEPERARRKAIRRALQRLRERGITAAALAPARSAAPLARPEPEREGFLSAVDGVGTRLVWVAVAGPTGAWLLVAAELNEPAGLTDMRVSEVPRKQLRAARQHLRERGIALVSVPFAVADALLVEGQGRRGVVERNLDYLRVRARLTHAVPAEPGEPNSPHVTVPVDEECPALVAASAGLLAEPELALWWPHPSDAAPFLRELDELDDSPIVLSPTQQEGRLGATLTRAADALYPRPVVARRLRATAYVFGETARPAAARMALAVAAALEHDPSGTRDIPLLTALTHQGLGRLAAARATERQKTRERSLVVTPGEVLRDRSGARPPRTRS
jgi:hypothetical protein